MRHFAGETAPQSDELLDLIALSGYGDKRINVAG